MTSPIELLIGKPQLLISHALFFACPSRPTVCRILATVSLRPERQLDQPTVIRGLSLSAFPSRVSQIS